MSQHWNVQTSDVGQADARSLSTPEGTKVLIDADEDRIADFTEKDDLNTIHHLLITHIHEDHVAGIQELKAAGCSIQEAHWPSAARYDIENGDVTERVLDKTIESLSDHDISLDEIDQLTTGDEILDEEEVSLDVLSPPATSDTVETTSQSTGYPCEFQPKNANANGAVCKFTGPNDVSGLFMGDVGDESAHNAESWLLEQHDNPESEVDLNADILFLGHHGSKYATGERFLEAVDPEHVVISSSLTNDYITSENQYDGHPHDETLERLHDSDVAVYWTAVHGTTSTTVEDGDVTIDHTTGIETTAAADLAALKYHARTTDLDQEQLEDIEEIDRTGLPDETPDWIREASLVTDTAEQEDETQKQQDEQDEQDDQRKTKINTLHTLEAEHRNLTERKEYIEGEHERLTEEKHDLEQEAEATSGMWGHVTDAVGQFRRTDTDAEPDDDAAHDETRKQPTRPPPTVTSPIPLRRTPNPTIKPTTSTRLSRSSHRTTLRSQPMSRNSHRQPSP